jgi:hypothetical protein
MQAQAKLLSKKKTIVLFLIGVISCLISSLAFFVNKIISTTNEDLKIYSIITSIQFWLFLLIEIFAFTYVSKALKKSRFNTNLADRFKLISIIQLVVFAISVVALIVGGIISHGKATAFEMFMVSLTVFLFQMIFVINSKMFKNIFGSERTKKDEKV